MKNKKAFTLIELLVVVLIIGILAAVALPQYTKSVEKSKYAEADIVMSSLAKLAQAHILATGDPDQEFFISDLPVEIPGTQLIDGSSREVVATKDFHYRVSLSNGASPSPYIFAYRKKGGTTLYSLMLKVGGSASSCSPACCWIAPEDEKSCISFGYNTVVSAACASTAVGCRRKA